MMTSSPYTAFLPLSLLFLIISSAQAVALNTTTTSDEKKDHHHDDNNVYIAYMGLSSDDNPESTEDAHLKLLEDIILRGPLAARQSMLYSYKHGFSGFAARLTEAEAKTLAVVYVWKSQKLELYTTRSWDFLGLSLGDGDQPPYYGKMGEGSIIGLIDTGVWPESPSFNDDKMGPVPKRWRGICESGEQFNASHCNRKLIGARYFSHGAGPSPPSFLSPRDSAGHGTHTSSTAGGSVVTGVSLMGLARGVARGGATQARLAMYKACWTRTCDESDILKAFDMAIHDGVDIISISAGRRIPLFPNGARDRHTDPISLGSYHAVARGITVVASAGNAGPDSYSVVNVAPWLITVGACTTDRRFLARISLLGDNSTLGQSWSAGEGLNTFEEIIHPESKGFGSNVCLGERGNGTATGGKIVLCFKIKTDPFQSMSSASNAVAQAGGVGLIYAQTRDDYHGFCSIPCIKVDIEVGTRILAYIKQSRTPMAKLGAPYNFIGTVASPRVAFFSSRGPNSFSPHVLKPDIVAPGVDILAAFPSSAHGVPMYHLESGTSMSAPHVAGIVSLLKVEHPDWSPGAIRSALVTTAWSSQTDGDEIGDGGVMDDKVADMFDIGGGVVNPIGSLDPGLIFNTSMEDYRLTPDQDHLMNLPYIIVPHLGTTEIAVTRTVTNVGPNKSVYQLQTVKAPFGTAMKVEPRTLEFNNDTKTATFRVTFVRTTKFQRGFSFGALTWSDDGHHHRVRIPVAVRVINFGVFGDV